MQTLPPPEPPPPREPSPPPSIGRQPRTPADALMNAYVGYLAGWFELGRLAAGRRLQRGGVRAPLLNDA